MVFNIQIQILKYSNKHKHVTKRNKRIRKKTVYIFRDSGEKDCRQTSNNIFFFFALKFFPNLFTMEIVNAMRYKKKSLNISGYTFTDFRIHIFIFHIEDTNRFFQNKKTLTETIVC